MSAIIKLGVAVARHCCCPCLLLMSLYVASSLSCAESVFAMSCCWGIISLLVCMCESVVETAAALLVRLFIFQQLQEFKYIAGHL